MNTSKRTYHLSGLALQRLDEIRKETGLKFSMIIERLILGLPVGEKPKPQKGIAKDGKNR